MSTPEPILLSVGEEYPFKIPESEGAVSDFLRSGGNRLIIVMPGISNEESKILRKYEMRGGLLVKNGAILFVWQFRKNGKPVVTLDSPFDARIIPDIQFYDIEDSKTRLVIDVHIVDSISKMVCGLRAVTMPPGMTLEFLSAVQDQIGDSSNGEKQYQSWMTSEPPNLAKQTKMWIMGK